MTSLYAQLTTACKSTRDPELRRKLYILLRGQELETVKDACGLSGISRTTYYRRLDRLKKADFAPQALCPESRAPRTSPRKQEGLLKDLILEMRHEFHYSARRIAWHLNRDGFPVSEHGVYNVLKRAQVPFRYRRPKKPNRHTKRYELDRPGQGLQLDIKYVPFRIETKKAYVFNAIDDCSRWRFQYAYRKMGVESALDFIQRLRAAAPFPIEQIQTDNDSSFTDRFQTYRNPDMPAHEFPQYLAALRILHKLIPPGIKELNGKVERSHKTDDQEFYWKLPSWITFEQFQVQLARWTYEYNHHRPHSSLKMRTPAERLNDFGWIDKTPKVEFPAPRPTHAMGVFRDLDLLRATHPQGPSVHIRFRTKKPKPLGVLDRAYAWALHTSPVPHVSQMSGFSTTSDR